MKAYYTELEHTSPTIVTLEQAKKQLKMEDLGTFDDDIIQDCIDAAIDEAENYCNTSIRQRKYKVQIASWEDNFEFKKQKVTAIDSVTYKDTSGNSQTLDAASYQLLPIDSYASVMQFTDFNNLPEVQEDNTTAVTINFTVGYADGKTPKAIQQAIKLLLTDNYEYRGDREKKENLASRIKLEPYKYYTVPNG
ncbi:head-tail connector protein [Mesoflavibacter profundi]|uniref:head-tail connector protein n=1 Tax=Mesoflavibacter profundi TaxID=2708110 RepID=UPI003512ABE6